MKCLNVKSRFTVLTVCHFQSSVSDISFSVIFHIFFPPPSFSFPPISVLFFSTIYFVSFPNQSFSFRPALISPSLIVDAVLQSSFTPSSSPMRALFYPPLSRSPSIPLCFPQWLITNWGAAFALSSHSVTSAEVWNNVLIGCGWHCLAFCAAEWVPCIRYHAGRQQCIINTALIYSTVE